jgi:hypothetical protein
MAFKQFLRSVYPCPVAMFSPLPALKCQYHSLFLGDFQISNLDACMLILRLYRINRSGASGFLVRWLGLSNPRGRSHPLSFSTSALLFSAF